MNTITYVITHGEYGQPNLRNIQDTGSEEDNVRAALRMDDTIFLNGTSMRFIGNIHWSEAEKKNLAKLQADSKHAWCSFIDECNRNIPECGSKLYPALLTDAPVYIATVQGSTDYFLVYRYDTAG